MPYHARLLIHLGPRPATERRVLSRSVSSNTCTRSRSWDGPVLSLSCFRRAHRLIATRSTQHLASRSRVFSSSTPSESLVCTVTVGWRVSCYEPTETLKHAPSVSHPELGVTSHHLPLLPATLYQRHTRRLLHRLVSKTLMPYSRRL